MRTGSDEYRLCRRTGRTLKHGRTGRRTRMTVLVTGATGTVGGALVPLLSPAGAAGASGEAVRVLVTSAESGDDLRGYDVQVVVGNLDRPETLDDALRGVRAAFL